MTVPTVRTIELSPSAKYLLFFGLGAALGFALGMSVAALQQPIEAPRLPSRPTQLVIRREDLRDIGKALADENVKSFLDDELKDPETH